LAFGFDEWRQKKIIIANLARWGSIPILLISLICLGGIYKIYVDPFIYSLKGEKNIIGLRDRTIAISEKANEADVCVLLSYSSEVLPGNNLVNFLTKPPRDENIFVWARNNNANCIIYDVITHKRDDMDDVLMVSPKIIVEKIEFIKNMYYLYWLHPEPTSGNFALNLERVQWPPKKEILFNYSGLFLPPESWGTWSIGKEVRLVFTQALPEQFTLTLDARAFGPNIGKPITLRLGDSVQTFTLTDQFQKKVLTVNNPQRVNELKFVVPKPTSPKELQMGEDDRKLGIALKQLEIDW
jgi:hypothetical protein